MRQRVKLNVDTTQQEESVRLVEEVESRRQRVLGTERVTELCEPTWYVRHAPEVLAREDFGRVLRFLDYSEYGGAPLLGVTAPLLDLRAVFNLPGPAPRRRRVVVVQGGGLAGSSLRADLLVSLRDCLTWCKACSRSSNLRFASTQDCDSSTRS